MPSHGGASLQGEIVPRSSCASNINRLIVKRQVLSCRKSRNSNSLDPGRLGFLVPAGLLYSSIQ